MHKDKWPNDVNVRWPNFTISEVECKCGCGQVPEFELMTALQRLRDRVRFPLSINSGFRCEEYDTSIKGAGVHPTGLAVNIGVGYDKAYEVVKWATHFGFTGVGVKGRGDPRFIHIDMIPEGEDQSHPRPRFWTYDS